SREFITRRASLDETEPDHGYPDQSGSLWWELSPPQGRLHIRLSTWSPGTAALRLYRGTQLGGLEPVALTESASEPGLFHADLVAGTYQLAIVGRAGDGARGNWSATLEPRPAHDAFAGALVLSGESAVLSAQFVSATVEPEEPPAPTERTLWWQWTAPATGTLDLVAPPLSSWGLGAAARVSVFTGSNLASLRAIPLRSSREVPRTHALIHGFAVEAGTRYWIRLESAYSASFDFQAEPYAMVRLELSRSWPLTHETLATSKRLEGTSLTEAGHLAGTREGTLWYSWQAPAEGLLHLRTDASNPGDRVDIVRAPGTPEALTLLSFSLGSAAVHVRPGETIAWSLTREWPEAFAFELRFDPGSPNDDWASRRILTGSSGEFTGDPSQATGTFEPNGEPTQVRTLVWEWTVPHAGRLHLEPIDGSAPGSGVFLRDPGNPETLVRGVAGRTYEIYFTGKTPRTFRYWIEPDQLQTQLLTSDPSGRVTLRLDGALDRVYRLDASDDLSRWQTIGWSALREAGVTLDDPAPRQSSRFYRLVPVW
ncbi:MAG: hypothetical protein IT580_24330, partial [Verrucomicrobiales bacterium]|nr:hypothetical protein [Verrucomicrobiales bacterium]